MARQNCEVLLKYSSKTIPMHSVLNATDHCKIARTVSAVKSKGPVTINLAVTPWSYLKSHLRVTLRNIHHKAQIYATQFKPKGYIKFLRKTIKRVYLYNNSK